MIDGIINVYKERGYTSFDVCAKLRGILKQKKVGHTGTLDPMAEGVLLVCLGKATKLVDMLVEGDKQYRTTLLLGTKTDTDDVTGNVLSTTKVKEDITDQIVTETIMGFVGRQKQIPPMYSAIKKDGKKLYEYARAGVNIEREPRDIEIYSISDISIDLPRVSFTVKCSKGTYIRSLCRDIGEKLMVGGTMQALIRQDVHGYTLRDSLTLSQIEQLHSSNNLEEHILPIDSLLCDYPFMRVNNAGKKLLYNGNKLYPSNFIDINPEIRDNDLVRVYDGDNCIAIYKYFLTEQIYKPYKMFLG